MKQRTRQNEQGLVALIVTLIMMIVITLIVTGFAQVTRRSQREALDSQLGTQAYYAAESGVNAAVKYINGNSVGTISSCYGGANPILPTLADGVLQSTATGGSGSVAYTCVLVNSTPQSIDAGAVDTAASKVEHLQTADNGNFSSLTFKWKPGSDGADFNNCGAAQGKYPIASAWTCPHGILRVDVFNARAPGLNLDDAANLASNTVTLYMQPGSTPATSPTLAFGGAVRAYQTKGCATDAADITSGTCSVTVNVPPSSSEYYVRMSMIYQQSSDVTITGEEGGNTATFANGQYVIDSTGRAQDELKRIQVRIPFTPSDSALPAFAVQSRGAICKDLSVTTTTVIDNCIADLAGSPGGDPLSGDLNGAIATGSASGGSSGPAPTCTGQCKYWTRTFNITQTPSGSGVIVTGCTWNWGDATSKPESASNCTVGTDEQHQFPTIDTCTHYTVTLTFQTNQGDIVVQKPVTITEPHGTDSGC